MRSRVHPEASFDDVSFDHNPEQPSRIAPGRVSLTSRLAPRPIVNLVVRDGGAGLPADVRAPLERSLGRDLDGVRVHTGTESAEAARAIGARAFATGDDIHFARGAYAPEDPFGLHLLAHEVAHTVQQGGQPSLQPRGDVSEPADPAEREAEAFADAFVRGTPAPAIREVPAAPIQRSPDGDDGRAPASGGGGDRGGEQQAQSDNWQGADAMDGGDDTMGPTSSMPEDSSMPGPGAPALDDGRAERDQLGQEIVTELEALLPPEVEATPAAEGSPVPAPAAAATAAPTPTCKPNNPGQQRKVLELPDFAAVFDQDGELWAAASQISRELARWRLLHARERSRLILPAPAPKLREPGGIPAAPAAGPANPGVDVPIEATLDDATLTSLAADELRQMKQRFVETLRDAVFGSSQGQRFRTDLAERLRKSEAAAAKVVRGCTDAVTANRAQHGQELRDYVARTRAKERFLVLERNRLQKLRDRDPAPSTTPKRPDTHEPLRNLPRTTGPGQRVDQRVAAFIEALEKQIGADATRPYAYSLACYTYPSHGPYRVDCDLTTQVRNPVTGDRATFDPSTGFYHRDAVKHFLLAANALAKQQQVSWFAIYNDATAARESNDAINVANGRLSAAQRRDHVGFVGDGGNAHGPAPFKLHIHLDLVPLKPTPTP